MNASARVYVGTYTEPILFGTGKILRGKGAGIHRYTLDPSTGALTSAGVTPDVRNPSYLAFDPTGRFMYAVNELKEFQGQFGGAVSAFRVDPTTGALTFLNSQATHGTDPCHLTVHPSGRIVLVANFMSGSVAVFPVAEDGTLAAASHVVQHEGSSVDPVRQTGPHAHAVTLDAAGRRVFVPDLGLDRLMIYTLDLEGGALVPNVQPWVDVAPGAGPRQVVMHPNGRFAYLINELNSTMTAYAYAPEAGTLAELQTLSTLPDDFTGASTCAEVQIAPDGRFLYGSNRGHDSVVVYAVDPAAGTLTTVGHVGTGGRTPRNFMVSPDGAFLLAANQDSDNIVVFRLDPATGLPVPTGHTVEVGTPVCIRVTTA